MWVGVNNGWVILTSESVEVSMALLYNIRPPKIGYNKSKFIDPVMSSC
jgi:hypothetical protein